MGTAQESPGHGGDIQPAHGTQHIQHIVLVNSPTRQRTAQHVLLAGEAHVCQSATPAGDGLDVRTGQHGQHRGGGAGVADTHLADTKGGDAVGSGARRLLHAGGHGGKRLRPGHSVLYGDVSGAPPDLPVQNVYIRHIAGNTHVHDGHIVAEGGGHGGHPGPAPGHVDGLLQGHGPGRAGHAFVHHAVVGGKHRHAAAVHFRAYLTGDTCQTDGYVLQRAQAPRRFGQLCLSFPGRVHHRPVCRADGLYILLQCCFCHVGSSIYPCAASQCSDGRAF